MAENTGNKTFLHEFLMGLGFHVDERSERKFRGSVEVGTRAVRDLGLAATAALGAVGAATTGITSYFNDLYFASKRTGDSAKFMSSFSFAASQLGSSTQEAMAGLEGIGAFIRHNPAALQFFRSNNISTASGSSEVMGIANLFRSRVAEMKQHGASQGSVYALAHVWAGLFGISDRLMLAMLSPNFNQYMQRDIALQKSLGLNLDDLARRSKDFAQQTRLLKDQVTRLGQRVFLDLLKEYGPQLERLTQYISDHLPQIRHDVEDFVRALVRFGREVDNVVESLGGWKIVLLSLAALTATSWAGVLVRNIGAVGEAIKGLTLASLAFGRTPLGAIILGSVAAYEASKGSIQHALDSTSKGREFKYLIGESIARGMAAMGSNSAEAALKADAGSASGTGVQRYNAHLAQSVLVGAGLSRARVAAMLGMFTAESSMNPFAVGDHGNAYGLGQLHPPRQAEYARLYGHSPQSVTNKDQAIREQVGFALWELTHGKGAKASSGQAFLDATSMRGLAAALTAFQGPKNPARETNAILGYSRDYLQGAPAQVTVQSHLTFNIEGTPTQSAMDAMASRHERVNNDLARELRTRLR